MTTARRSVRVVTGSRSALQLTPQPRLRWLHPWNSPQHATIYAMKNTDVINESPPVRRKRQRRARYPVMFNLRISEADYQRIERLADLEGYTLAEAARGVLSGGLPKAISAARRRASRAVQ